MDLLWDNTITTLFRCDGESPIYLHNTSIEELRWSDEHSATAVLHGPPLVLYKHIHEGVTLEVLCGCPGALRSDYDSSIVVIRLSNVRNVEKRLPMVIAAFPSDSASVFLEATFTCDIELLEGENS